jgi:hypothetical protein
MLGRGASTSAAARFGASKRLGPFYEGLVTGKISQFKRKVCLIETGLNQVQGARPLRSSLLKDHGRQLAMNGIFPQHLFGRLDSINVKVDDHRLLA